MNVKIKTVYGELSLNMALDNALALIEAAHKYAEAYATEAEQKRDDMIDALTYAVPSLHIGNKAVKGEKESNAPPSEKPAHKSRIESLFGAKADWKLPPATSAPEEITESGADTEPQTYKGFLYIECEECGTVKGFCIKSPIEYHKCECGHETALRNLRTAHVRCECESNFKYNTNIQRDAFTINCLHCGSPVDMELGGKGKSFVSVAFSEMKKKGREKR